jgi:hypothetical protein
MAYHLATNSIILLSNSEVVLSLDELAATILVNLKRGSSIHAVHLGETTIVTKVTRPGVGAVMAEVARNLAAMVARATD